VKKLIAILSFTVLLGGCVTTPISPLSEVQKPFSKFLRGTVYLDGNDYKFRNCGATDISTLVDHNEQLETFFNQLDGHFPSLFVEFDAVAAANADWQVEKIYFAANKPKNCTDLANTSRYIISDVKGLWNAEISDEQVSIRKKGIYTQLVFSAQENQDNKWRASMVLPQGSKYDMSLALKNSSCTDHQQQWYSMSADLVLNGERLTGCVRKSITINNFVSGDYSNILADNAAFIVLSLKENQDVELIIDSRNGNPMVVTSGRWSILPNQVLELSLNSSYSENESTVMLFQVFNNQELRLKGFSEVLGKTGLKLLPIKQ